MTGWRGDQAQPSQPISTARTAATAARVMIGNMGDLLCVGPPADGQGLRFAASPPAWWLSPAKSASGGFPGAPAGRPTGIAGPPFPAGARAANPCSRPPRQWSTPAASLSELLRPPPDWAGQGQRKNTLALTAGPTPSGPVGEMAWGGRPCDRRPRPLPRPGRTGNRENQRPFSRAYCARRAACARCSASWFFRCRSRSFSCIIATCFCEAARRCWASATSNSSGENIASPRR